MPTYEYRCNECGDHFEVEQRMTDDALVTHDKCGGKLSKVFSSAGIVLKGSGFYKTDGKDLQTKNRKHLIAKLSPINLRKHLIRNLRRQLHQIEKKVNIAFSCIELSILVL